MEEINDGVYWITEGTYQLMFVVTDDGVIVADAPPTIGDNILAAVGEVTDKPITHVIYSHSHIDQHRRRRHLPDRRRDHRPPSHPRSADPRR